MFWIFQILISTKFLNNSGKKLCINRMASLNVLSVLILVVILKNYLNYLAICLLHQIDQIEYRNWLNCQTSLKFVKWFSWLLKSFISCWSMISRNFLFDFAQSIMFVLLFSLISIDVFSSSFHLLLIQLYQPVHMRACSLN